MKLNNNVLLDEKHGNWPVYNWINVLGFILIYGTSDPYLCRIATPLLPFPYRPPPPPSAQHMNSYSFALTNYQKMNILTHIT